MEPDPTTLINNQTGKPIKWPTIIICVIFVITGQSIARLLETFHNHNTNPNHHDPIWTQPLLQVIGFPLLLLPFFLLSSKKHNQLLITSDRTSLAVLYLCTGIIMVVQVRLYVKGKLELPYTVSLLLDSIRIYFTLIFTSFINKIKFNLWIVFTLIFTITIAIVTLSSSFNGEWSALLAAFTFSFVLCNIHSIFKNVISNSNKRELCFVDVLELLIFSSLFATVATVFISGENQDLKREMDGFLKGKLTYVLTMVGQAAAWQIYWVGIVGLVVFADSIVIPNVISFSTYPIVTVLKILFCNYEEDEFDGFLGAALAFSAIAVVSCFYKRKRGFGNSKPPRLWLVFVFFVVYYLYVSEFLISDPYMSPPTGFEFFWKKKSLCNILKMRLVL